ncbi:DNA primase [Marinicella sp. S1101]|uniref:DNA primase n=1 Tax=Marinicella marina TaxID=2996016 RepID=UPI002260D18E|nr:DNA primase [Marinicella marina]MCX7554543.1 DNA primase [Marinicella marina]MDJ1141073.1 DNA primase [Marinicella marina]
MSSIPNEFIETLLDRIDITDVVGARVSLKKAGKDYSGLCPFHAENTPSFTVSQQKQFYHCFGCGKNGSAIGFLMEYEGLDFVDAVKDLAQLAGMQVPASNFSGNQKPKTNLYAVTEKAARVFQHQLRSAAAVIDYLKGRQISGQTSKTFQLGYALNEWDALSKRYSDEEQSLLARTGLTTSNDSGRVYDKFRNRLMFPIHDKRGRVIAFGGRAIETDQKPKYLNSPETDLFHKSNELYGLHLARKHSDENFIIVVEGYMDVIALHEKGICNAVATLGTATSAQHIKNLFKVWDRIVFCFDGDGAGVQAAEKALITALPLYLDNKIIEFLFLPQGEDPDSYVLQHGQSGFLAALDAAKPLSDFMIEIISKDINTKSIDGKAQLHEKAKPFINQLPKGAFKTMIAQQISEISGMSMQVKNPIKPQQTGSDTNDNPLRKLISLLLNTPQLCENLSNQLNFDTLSFKGTEIVDKIVEIQHNNPQINSAAMMEHFRNSQYARYLGHLMRMYDHLDDTQKALEFEDIVSYLKKLSSQAEIERLRNKQLESGLDSAEKQALVQLLREKSNQ